MASRKGAGDGGKRAAHVPVYYFEKRKGLRRTVEAGEGPSRAEQGPRTLPEVRLPFFTEEAGRDTAARRAVTPPERSARGGRRRSTPLDTTPAVHPTPPEVPSASLHSAREAATANAYASRARYGYRLFEQGRLEAAQEVFEGLVELPGVRDAFASTMLGTILLARGQHVRALALFECALDMDPDDLAARVYRGELYLKEGRVGRAVADLEHALRLAPAHEPFVQRARKLLALSRRAPARRRNR